MVWVSFFYSLACYFFCLYSYSRILSQILSSPIKYFTKGCESFSHSQLSKFICHTTSEWIFFFDLALTESHWFHQNILCRIKITLCLYKAKKYNILLHKSLELHDRNYSHLKRLQKKNNKVWVQENGVQCAMVWRNVALAPEGEVVEKLFQLFECRMFIPVFGMNVKDEQLVNICWLKREEKANHQ